MTDNMKGLQELKGMITAVFESARQLKAENEILKKELRKIKVCSTCCHYDDFNMNCRLHGKCKNHHLWEIRK